MYSSLIQLNKEIQKYLNKGIIVDTEPLLLLLVGHYDPEYIEKFKLTNKFRKDDFKILSTFLSHFKKIVVTPHILAETSNFAFKIKPEERLKKFMLKAINLLKEFKEIYITKDDILIKEEIKKYGVADTGILLSCEDNDFMIITKDRPFANMCKSKSLPTLHFDELRGINWFN